MSRDLATKLIERARASAQAGKDGAQVDTDLTQAKRWGADPKDIQAVQQAQSAGSAALTGWRQPRGSAAAAGLNPA